MGLFRNTTKFILPIVVILLGFLGMRFFQSMKTPPKRVEKRTQGLLVEVMHAKVRDIPVEIWGTGEVQAKEEIKVVPEVSGRVTWVNPLFERGGILHAGDVLFRIDKTDIEAEVASQKEALSQARLNLEEISQKAESAISEWKKIKGEGQRPKNPLVFYEPQLEAAKAGLAAARARYAKALKDLARTVVRAPFDCVVKEESVGVGRFVRGGESVGDIVSTDAFEVVVPLSLRDTLNMAEPSNKAWPVRIFLRQENTSKDFEWNGVLERFLPDLDSKGRMVRAIVVVDDPLQRKKTVPGRPELRIGEFVDVRFRGKVLKGVVELPERAIKEQEYVWLVEDGGMLHIERVDILWRQRGQVIVRGAIKDGDLCVLSSISGASEGMRIRPVVVDGGRR